MERIFVGPFWDSIRFAKSWVQLHSFLHGQKVGVRFQLLLWLSATHPFIRWCERGWYAAKKLRKLNAWSGFSILDWFKHPTSSLNASVILSWGRWNQLFFGTSEAISENINQTLKPPNPRDKKQPKHMSTAQLLHTLFLGTSKKGPFFKGPKRTVSTSYDHSLAVSIDDTYLSNKSFYIYGYGSKNPLDRPAVIRTSGTRGLRKGAWSRGLQGAKWYDTKCLHESVARPKVTWKGGEIWNRSSKFHGLWINSLKQGRKPNNHKFLTRRHAELVVVWIGSGSVWIRVWIGLGLGLELNPIFLCMLQLGCSVTRKGQQGEGSKWTPWLLGSLALQQFQLGS